MSSRALRRLQREQEEARLAQQVAESEEEEDDDQVSQKPVQRSAFEVLNGAGDDEDEDDEEHNGTPPDEDADEDDVVEPEPLAAPKASKKPKKKKKKKAKGKAPATETAHDDDSELDEIDKALQALKTSEVQHGKAPTTDDQKQPEYLAKFYSLLSVNRNDLNALNEMKKLFGSAVLRQDAEEEAEQNRRRPRAPHDINLAQALSARYSTASGGQGLSGLALRQNVFLPGKPTWPRLPSGGLTMEIVEKLDDDTVEYRFVHKPEYQRAQKKFEEATRTLQSDAIISLALKQPYHVATLLQLGEILKHQGDHALAGDMYERALYNFGRSAQSTFSKMLAEGKARMMFRRPENREFWLTSWRYINTCVERGTLRTAYEWAKLLLSLDPEGVEGDPYRIRLIIDQLALRCGQAEHFVDLVSEEDSVDWGQHSANIRISVGLAHWRLKEMEKAESCLTAAVKDYPWIFVRLFQELGIDKVPPSIWGQQPRTPYEEFETESYALRAKDIWKVPERISFLRKVVEAAPKADPPQPDTTRTIGINEARHAIVADLPRLLSTLPREFTNMPTTSSDPLPPEGNIPDYATTATEQDIDDEMDELEEVVRREAQAQNAGGEGGGLTGWLGAAINRFLTRNPEQPLRPEDVQREIDRAVRDGSRPGGQAQNLGEELGMETVTVRTPDEYDAAMASGQFPVVAADAAEAFNRLLHEREGNDGARNVREAQREADDAARLVLQETERRELAENRLRQERRQATVEDEDGEEGGASTPPLSALGTPVPKPYDEDANKRWLAGRGMLAIKDFVAARGSDENVWKDEGIPATEVPSEYIERIGMLRQASNRNWILDFALRQGAGKEASDMIKRLLASGWNPR